MFATFSPVRLFTPVGSDRTVYEFFIPGTDEPATSRGFGVVFTDVNVQGSTTVELFDVWNNSLGLWEAPVGPTPAESLSFVGIDFEDAIVARVEIVTGNLQGADPVVMDDFIYGEPNGVINNDDFCFYLSLFAAGC